MYFTLQKHFTDYLLFSAQLLLLCLFFYIPLSHNLVHMTDQPKFSTMRTSCQSENIWLAVSAGSFKIIEFGLGSGDCKCLEMITLIVGYHKSNIHTVFVCSTVAASSENTSTLSRSLDRSLPEPVYLSVQMYVFALQNVYCLKFTNIS